MSGSSEFEAEAYLPAPAQRPVVLVVFGGAGALAKAKLLPAVYNLAHNRLLPKGFALLAAARTPRSDDDYRDIFRQAVVEHSRRSPDPGLLADLLRRSYYQPVRADRRADLVALGRRLTDLDSAHGTGGGRLFYLATPPGGYESIIRGLGGAGLARCGQTDPSVGIAVEKPFGSDLASAAELNKLLRRCLEERRIYRIDHFLGKETVQNLLVFRFANAIFEPLLRREYVHDVQITVAEDGGVADRGAYYESAGALRDMVQSHLLQLLCLVAAEPPARLDGEAIRDEKVKVLRAIGPLAPRQAQAGCVRGQYTAAGELAGYRQEAGVSGDSQMETFVAVRLEVGNRRWAGVPFYLRTGKRLARRVAEIVVTFAREPARLFGPKACDWRGPNRLIFRLQPEQGISIVFDAKAPGAGVLLRPVRMDFDYERAFSTAGPEAYERLLLDALLGRGSLFARGDEVEASWEIVDSIRAGWVRGRAAPPLPYECGSWGPGGAGGIFADPETSWQTA